MDETDMATENGPQSPRETGAVTSSEATLAVPGVPQQRDGSEIAAIKEHFETPTWLGSGSALGQVPAPHSVVPSPTVPEQHRHGYAFPQPPTERPFIEEGHWVERTRPRFVAGAVLVLAIMGVVGFLALSIITQSVVAIVALFSCSVVAVLFRSALVATGITRVELKGPRLHVSRDGVHDEFDLLDPLQPVEVIGTPQDPQWRLLLEALDGRVIELSSAHVDPGALHPAVEYYQAIADRERADRERRFNR